jgi:hypothetical protein
MLLSPGRRGALKVVQLAAVEAREDEVLEAAEQMRAQLRVWPCLCLRRRPRIVEPILHAGSERRATS